MGRVAEAFRLDPSIARAFRLRCRLLGIPIGETLEALMARFLEETEGRAPGIGSGPGPRADRWKSISIRAQLIEAKLALREALRILEGPGDGHLKEEYLRRLARSIPRASFLCERTGDSELVALLERAGRHLR